MNFILSIYDHSMVMHVIFHQDILGNRGVIALRFSKKSLNVSVLSLKLASNRPNFMKLIQSIYDHSVMMYVMQSDVEKVLPFDCLNIIHIT